MTLQSLLPKTGEALMIVAMAAQFGGAQVVRPAMKQAARGPEPAAIAAASAEKPSLRDRAWGWWKKAQDTAKSAKDAVVQKAEQTYEKAKGLIERTLQMLGKAKEKTVEAKDAIVEKTKEVYEKAKGLVERVIGKEPAPAPVKTEPAPAKKEEAPASPKVEAPAPPKPTLKERALVIWEKTKEKTAEAKEAVVKAKDAVVEKAKETYEKAKEGLTKAAGAVKDAVSPILEKLPTPSEVWNKIRNPKKAEAPEVGPGIPIQEKAAAEEKTPAAPERTQTAAEQFPELKEARTIPQPKQEPAPANEERADTLLKAALSALFNDPVEQAVVEHLARTQNGGVQGFLTALQKAVESKSEEGFKKGWALKARKAVERHLSSEDTALAEALGKRGIKKENLLSYYCSGRPAPTAAEGSAANAMGQLMTAAGNAPEGMGTSFDGSAPKDVCAEFDCASAASRKAEESRLPRTQVPSISAGEIPAPGESAKKNDPGQKAQASEKTSTAPQKTAEKGGIGSFLSSLIPSGCGSKPK